MSGLCVGNMCSFSQGAATLESFMPHCTGAPRATKMKGLCHPEPFGRAQDKLREGSGEVPGQRSAPDASPLRLAQHDTFRAMVTFGILALEPAGGES